MTEKLDEYVKRISSNGIGFINAKALEALIRIEEQEDIDEMAFLKALELLNKNLA